MEKNIVKKIKNKEVGFRFTMETVSEFCRKSGCDFSGIDEQFIKDPFGSTNTLLLSANKVYKRGQEMTRYDIDDIIDIMTDTDLQEVVSVWHESVKDMVSKYVKSTDNDDKKK